MRVALPNTAEWRNPCGCRSPPENRIALARFLRILWTNMANDKPTHGGPREGAGRPAGTGAGRTVESKSVSMSPAAWVKLDALRGKLSRGAYIAKKLKL